MGVTISALAACFMAAELAHGVSAKDLVAIYEVEGGWPGAEISAAEMVNAQKQRVKTWDLGLMQVNSSWVPELSEVWQADRQTVYRMLRDDACININAAGYVLRKKIDGAGGNRLLGIAHYNNRRPEIGVPYLVKVLKAMKRQQQVASLPPKNVASKAEGR